MLTQNTLQKRTTEHLWKASENTPKVSVTDDKKHIQKTEGGGRAVIMHVNSTIKLFHFLELSIFKWLIFLYTANKTIIYQTFLIKRSLSNQTQLYRSTIYIFYYTLQHVSAVQISHHMVDVRYTKRI